MNKGEHTGVGLLIHIWHLNLLFKDNVLYCFKLFGVKLNCTKIYSAMLST